MSERRQNVIAVAIAFGVTAVALGLAFRPGVIFGPGPGAVANSLHRSLEGIGVYDGARRGSCEETSDERLRCRIFTGIPGSDGSRAPYEVRVGWDGCWDAERTRGGGAVEPIEGCVSIFDY